MLHFFYSQQWPQTVISYIFLGRQLHLHFEFTVQCSKAVGLTNLLLGGFGEGRGDLFF